MTESSDAFKKKIHEDVLKTGFPTEVVAASDLENIDWFTSLGLSYLDDQTEVSREFDVRAYKEVKGRHADEGYYFGIYLVMECKKSSKPWVIFTSDNSLDTEYGKNLEMFISHPRAGKEDFWPKNGADKKAYLSNDLLKAYHHYFDSKRWGHNYYEAFKGRENADHANQIYTAINSVTNAIRFYLKSAGNPGGGWKPVYYPVVVLEGQLFEAIVQSSSVVDLEERDHIVLKYHKTFPFDRNAARWPSQSYLIDIVRSEYLSTFAKKLVNDHAQIILNANRNKAAIEAAGAR